MKYPGILLLCLTLTLLANARENAPRTRETAPSPNEIPRPGEAAPRSGERAPIPGETAPHSGETAPRSGEGMPHYGETFIDTTAPRPANAIRDTARPVRRKFDSSLFSDNNAPTQSDYLESLEKVFQLLNHIPLVTSSFVKMEEVREHLDMEDSALAILKDRLTQSDRNFNIRNLQMFNTLLDELDRNTGVYSKYLEACDNKLDEAKKGIAGLKKDTLMLHIFRDSALRTSLQPQLQQLKGKWRLVDSLVRTSTTTINTLKARASADAITVEELLYRVDAELKAVGNRAFGKERRYLWEPRSGNPSRFSEAGARKSVDSEQKLAAYYFVNTRSNRLWLLITGLVFFYWIWYNFRSLKKLDSLKAVAGFNFQYINPRPFLATLIFVLSLAPLFDLHAPAIYIESTQFLLILLVTIILRKKLTPRLFLAWCLFILLFLLPPITRIIGLPVSLYRWFNLIGNGVSVTLALLFLLSRNKKEAGHKLILWAAGIYAFLNLLAVICNLAGRVTLAQIFGSAAVYAFAQTVSLSVFVQSIVEAFLLQIQGSRIRKKYPEHFEYAEIVKSVYRFSMILATLLWLIVFTTNMNVFDLINDSLVTALSAPHAIGSLSFTLGEITMFLGIIWTANFLQRYIAYFFGDTGDDAATDDKGQRSKLLVTRLILLTAGFLLAVAASGLPIDKITVVLGALGVGIGLGLQSIVNNFVSGIILIFDR